MKREFENLWKYIKYLPVGIVILLAHFICNAEHEFPSAKEIYTIFDGYGVEYSIIALLVGCVVCYTVNNKEINIVQSFKQKRLLFFLSFIFAIFQVAGSNMAYLDSLMIKFGITWILVFAFCVIGYVIAFYTVSTLVLYALCQVQSASNSPKERGYMKWGILCFVIILCCWLVWIIAYYPASVDYDAEWQICSFLGLRARSNHHPWISSCIIGSFFLFGRKLNNDNFGIFLYVIIRAILMAIIYARGLVYIRKENVNRIIALLALGFYSLTPVWGAYSKQPFKDTFAAALFCWYILRITILVNELYKGHILKARDCFIYAFSGLAVSLFRNNYLYVMLPVTIMLLFEFFKHKVGIKKMGIILTGIILYFTINFCITHYWGVEPTEVVEALSIPFQQTARTVKYYGDTMTEEEILGIKGILDFDNIGNLYDPVMSDPVKATGKLKANDDDYAKYFETWFNQLFKHPITYIEATIAGTYGYYSFTKDGYPSGGYGNCGMVIIDGINKDHNAHFDEYFDFNYVNSFQTMRTMLENYYRIWHKIPFLNLTDIIPAYTWLLILLILYTVLNRRMLLLIPLFAVLIGLLTCIASPINGSFRYIAPIAASFPVLLACLKPIDGIVEKRYEK